MVFILRRSLQNFDSAVLAVQLPWIPYEHAHLITFTQRGCSNISPNFSGSADDGYFVVIRHKYAPIHVLIKNFQTLAP